MEKIFTQKNNLEQLEIVYRVWYVWFNIAFLMVWYIWCKHSKDQKFFYLIFPLITTWSYLNSFFFLFFFFFGTGIQIDPENIRGKIKVGTAAEVFLPCIFIMKLYADLTIQNPCYHETLLSLCDIRFSVHISKPMRQFA